jgi:hypothetical protein
VLVWGEIGEEDVEPTAVGAQLALTLLTLAALGQPRHLRHHTAGHRLDVTHGALHLTGALRADPIVPAAHAGPLGYGVALGGRHEPARLQSSKSRVNGSC